MLRYATDGASVGPHVDQYDVFLIQAEGRRHWSVGAPGAGETLDADGGLRLVAPFEASVEVLPYVTNRPSRALHSGMLHW